MERKVIIGRGVGIVGVRYFAPALVVVVGGAKASEASRMVHDTPDECGDSEGKSVGRR